MNDRNGLRREARRGRARAAANGKEAATGLLNNFLASVPHEKHDVVAGYWPVGTEMDDLPILRKLRSMNTDIALPAVVATESPLEFRSWDDRESLVPGRFNIPTPPDAAPVVQPTLVVVPLLLFDGVGHRLGSGKGFYDRTLAAMRDKSEVIAVGVAYAAQRTARLEPLATDQKLDGIVTEEGTEWF
jgi:5-formyltetrahydrofolate cyclo-ligase